MPEAFGFSVPTEVDQLADPSRTAVIIYDMQVGIISQIKEGAAVLKNCVELVAAARGSGYRIFFTRHMWLPLRAAGVGQLRRAMIWQRTEDSAKLVTPFMPGSGPWQIAAELNPGAGRKLAGDALVAQAVRPVARHLEIDGQIVADRFRLFVVQSGQHQPPRQLVGRHVDRHEVFEPVEGDDHGSEVEIRIRWSSGYSLSRQPEG